MTEYIRQYTNLVIQALEYQCLGDAKSQPPSEPVLDAKTAIKSLRAELERLDPRDFDPSKQTSFVRVRANIAHMAELPGIDCKTFGAPLAEMRDLLGSYRGAGSSRVTRQFPYLTTPDLRAIVDRDYIELNARVFPAGAWKSTVIMAGSILEAILFDVLSDPKRVAATNASPKGARARGGVPIDITADPDSWKLTHLIEVAVDTGVLPTARGDTIDQVLRDYRNFVHPQKELRAQHECNEAEAGLAKYGLDGVCDHLEKTL